MFSKTLMTPPHGILIALLFVCSTSVPTKQVDAADAPTPQVTHGPSLSPVITTEAPAPQVTEGHSLRPAITTNAPTQGPPLSPVITTNSPTSQLAQGPSFRPVITTDAPTPAEFCDIRVTWDTAPRDVSGIYKFNGFFNKHPFYDNEEANAEIAFNTLMGIQVWGFLDFQNVGGLARAAQDVLSPELLSSPWIDITSDIARFADIIITCVCEADEPERLGDGYCDYNTLNVYGTTNGGYNTLECDWDGGDCCRNTCTNSDFDCGTNGFECWDSCDVMNPELLGDGFCDSESPGYNTLSCKWDYGDCCDHTCVSTAENECGSLFGSMNRTRMPVDACLDSCGLAPSVIGNAVCDDNKGVNIEQCDWDGGDCCEETCDPDQSGVCGQNGYICEEFCDMYVSRIGDADFVEGFYRFLGFEESYRMPIYGFSWYFFTGYEFPFRYLQYDADRGAYTLFTNEEFSYIGDQKSDYIAEQEFAVSPEKLVTDQWSVFGGQQSTTIEIDCYPDYDMVIAGFEGENDDLSTIYRPLHPNSRNYTYEAVVQRNGVDVSFYLYHDPENGKWIIGEDLRSITAWCFSVITPISINDPASFNGRDWRVSDGDSFSLQALYSSQEGDWCSGLTELTDKNGWFGHNINHNAPYINYQNCDFLVKPQNMSETDRISLSFAKVELYAEDVILVYDGTTTAAPRIGIVSGSYSRDQLVFKSTGQSMFITFTTNGRGVKTGWIAGYTTPPDSPSDEEVPPEICPETPIETSEEDFSQNCGACTPAGNGFIGYDSVLGCNECYCVSFTLPQNVRFYAQFVTFFSKLTQGIASMKVCDSNSICTPDLSYSDLSITRRYTLYYIPQVLFDVTVIQLDFYHIPQDCDVALPGRVGDGWCDPEYNIKQCDYDGGDCCSDTCISSEFQCDGWLSHYVCIDPSVLQTALHFINESSTQTFQGSPFYFLTFHLNAGMFMYFRMSRNTTIEFCNYDFLNCELHISGRGFNVEVTENGSYLALVYMGDKPIAPIDITVSISDPTFLTQDDVMNCGVRVSGAQSFIAFTNGNYYHAGYLQDRPFFQKSNVFFYYSGFSEMWCINDVLGGEDCIASCKDSTPHPADISSSTWQVAKNLKRTELRSSTEIVVNRANKCFSSPFPYTSLIIAAVIYLFGLIISVIMFKKTENRDAISANLNTPAVFTPFGVALAIADFVAIVLLLISLYDESNPLNNWLLVFIVTPIFSHIVILIKLIYQETRVEAPAGYIELAGGDVEQEPRAKGDVEQAPQAKGDVEKEPQAKLADWYGLHRLYTWTVVLCSIPFGISLLKLLYCNMNRIAATDMPLKNKTKEQLRWYGIFKNFLKDVPQLVIQFLVLINRRDDSTVVMSLTAKLLSVSFGFFSNFFQVLLARADNSKEDVKSNGIQMSHPPGGQQFSRRSTAVSSHGSIDYVFR